ncbi:MAG: hypothetical protein DRJ01_18100, partial [Bacteroidetes bacterium]
MKKVTFVLIILSIFGFLFASFQKFDTAQKIAINFLNHKMQNLTVSDKYEIVTSKQTIAYVFNLEPNGFVIVSANNEIYPIIAYSFTNQLEQNNYDENLIFQMLERDISLKEDFYQSNHKQALENKKKWDDILQNKWLERDFQQWPSAGSTTTDGWVETKWGQSGVFNQFCPIDNSGQRSVVGCVATAMAMIVDFHKYIGTISFSDYDDYYCGNSYPYIHIDNDHEERDFPSFPELNVYLDTLRNHYNNDIPLTGQDKGALSFACGISIQMNYDSEGSGAWTSNVADALLNKFDFYSAEWIDNYGNYFYEQLSNEMISMRPAEITIYTAGYNDGHAIICDGYNTDNYYHLNYGWGTSNNTCWYLLPEGMPYNYSIVSGAVINIEAGDIPINVQGDIDLVGASPIGTYITLEGEYNYECYVSASNGSFEIPSVLEGNYLATAILDRIYYQSQEVYLDEYNHFIQFNLNNFDAVTGTVNAPITPENCMINLYQNNEIIYSGISNSQGNYSIPDVLPGNYVATASLSGNYFQTKNVTITSENQTIDFDLEEYVGNISLSYSNDAIGIWTLIPDYSLSCGIRFTPDELIDFNNDIFSKVRFKSPINSDEGELFGQIWEENTLISEKQITNFNKGEWVEIVLDCFIPISLNKDYYVGYKVHSLNGDFAYYDAGPRVSGKGAYIRANYWVELGTNLDFNFCIEAIAASQNYGTISGSVQIDEDNENVEEVSVRTNYYKTRPNSNGNYQLDLKAGTYNLNAYLNGYGSDTISGIIVNNGETVQNQNFNMITATPEDIVLPAITTLIGNYPNPFNPTTTISFSLSNEQNKQNEQTKLEIYNLKGQKVKTFSNLQINKSTNQQIIWD